MIRTTIYMLARLQLEPRAPKNDDDYYFLINRLERLTKKRITWALDIVQKCTIDFKLQGQIVRYKNK